MANTYVDYVAGSNPSSLTDFPITFPYLSYLHIKVKVNGVEKALVTDFNVTVTTDGQTRIVQFNSNVPVLAAVHIYRDSDANTSIVDFENGSVLTESQLDLSYLHNLYLSEENKEQKDLAETRAKARANHTGTQTASTISDFDTEVANNPDVVANTAKNSYPSVDATKVGFISVTQAVDLDAMEADIATNNAKVTNATHTGEVTGSTTLTITNGAVTSDKISDTDNTFNIQSDGKIGMGCIPQDDQFSTATLAVDGAIETRRDRQTGTPEGGQLILRSEDSNGYRWNIDNFSRAAGDRGSILRIWRTDESDGGNGRVYLTIDPSDGKVAIGQFHTANYPLDVLGDINTTTSYKVNGNNLLLDEDTMASDSATQGATQQSIKAYIDSKKYSSGWVDQDDRTTPRSVASRNYLAFRHNLGTTDVSVTIYAAEDSSGTNAARQQAIVLYDNATNIFFERGLHVTYIDNTWVYVQLADTSYTFTTGTGAGDYLKKEWGTGTDGAGVTKYSHLKVVVQA